jgi:hypothetical protein
MQFFAEIPPLLVLLEDILEDYARLRALNQRGGA